VSQDPLREVSEIRSAFRKRLDEVGGVPALIQEVRNEFLGRSRGRLTALLKTLKDLPPAQRGTLGAAANALRGEIEEGLASSLASAGTTGGKPGQSIDTTLPGPSYLPGTAHPLTLVRLEIEEIFLRMGYTVEDGPEVESDHYNFTALNIPADHPARDMQDTLYLEGGGLLRTHTSPVQVRTMLKTRPPLKIICPGRAYRRDAPDATHSPVFNQVEALVVDHGISLGDLKGTLHEMGRRLFGPRVRVRLIPSYFPFVEPGAQFDVSCFVCDGAGCRTCKRSGWIEMGGAGMVHPAVLEGVGYDSEEWTGFAFGCGIDRIAMVKYDINDIRLLYENDVRFLEQFRGAGA